jgi:hypothetical protein
MLTHQPMQHEGKERQRIGLARDLRLQLLHHRGIKHRRLRPRLAAEHLARLADDTADLAQRHRAERQGHLVDVGEDVCALHAAVGIGADRHQQQRRIRVDRGAGALKEPGGFGAGVGGEQLLALIKTQDGERIGRLIEQGAARGRLPQLLHERDELTRRRQPIAQRGTGGAQRKARVNVFQRRQEPFAALDGPAAARADRLQRQPLAVVAVKPRPQAGAQE